MVEGHLKSLQDDKNIAPTMLGETRKKSRLSLPGLSFKLLSLFLAKSGLGRWLNATHVDLCLSYKMAKPQDRRNPALSLI